MGHQFECKACGRRLTVPDELFASKIRGRMVAVKCKGCGASVGIDGTIPPPPIESNEAHPSHAPAAPSEEVELEQTEPALTLPDDGAPPAATPKNASPSSKLKLREIEPTSSKPFDLSRRSSRPPPASSRAQPPRPSTHGPTHSEASISDDRVAPRSSRKPTFEATTAPRSTIPPPPNHSDVTEHAPTAPEEDWEADSPSGTDQRISYVGGSIPVRHPTARIGRYALFDQFAEGGIATVHFGRIDGAGGFSRVVAIKRLLPHLVANEEFTEMLLKEARFAARVRHPNVVPTLDVVASQGDVLLVLEYIHGDSLSGLARKQAKTRKDHIPAEIAAAVMLDVLSGLSAVHEATDEKGRALLLVHRDISPPNVVVGADGYARVLDFGIAKALEQIDESMPTRLKGKIGYMAPEQIRGEGVSQRSDVFAAGVILWEVLATRRMFTSGTETDRMKEIVSGNYPRLRQYRPSISQALEDVTMKALSVNPAERYANAREFADALEQAAPRASARRVSEWVRDVAAETLDERLLMIAQVENWNAGKAIPLHSSAFAAEAVQAFETLRPPTGTTDTAPHAKQPLAKVEKDSALTAAVDPKPSSRSASWLLIASCLILLLALYYTVFR